MYALDSIGDKNLSRPDRLVLISPMVGITRVARYADLAGLPAMLPAFAKAAWLGIVPEFNPFKYNSFPANGARQSYRLTRDLQVRIARYVREGQTGTVAADPYFSIADRFHGEHAGHRIGPLCAASGERPRVGAVRR
jgi:alpha-beta hydrolase superfamily lysophospholipase